MDLSTSDLQKISEIIQHLTTGNVQWLKENAILWGDKGECWILNYVPGPRNEYNRLVRGMVIRKPENGFDGNLLSLIWSFPFIRFFNHGESDAAYVDFCNAVMNEKKDGTMVGTFFPQGDPTKPEFHTRKMVSMCGDDLRKKVSAFNGVDYNMMAEINKYVEQLRFNESDLRHTYIFEFIHDASAVVTKYQSHEFGLYLLAGRNLDTYRELTVDQLDSIAQRIGCFRPRYWDAIRDFDHIQNLMAEMCVEIDDFEGFVFQDKTTGHRVKLKNLDYVKKHQSITTMRMRTLLCKLLLGEDEEIIAYQPKAKEKFDTLRTA